MLHLDFLSPRAFPFLSTVDVPDKCIGHAVPFISKIDMFVPYQGMALVPLSTATTARHNGREFA
jgi:hypothetical protein